MRSTPLVDERSASVRRFNGRYPASLSFKITFTTASASEPAPAGGPPPPGRFRRPTFMRGVVPAPDLRDERQCQTIGRAGGGSPSWSAVCTPARALHRSRNIGETQSVRKRCQGALPSRPMAELPALLDAHFNIRVFHSSRYWLHRCIFQRLRFPVPESHGTREHSHPAKSSPGLRFLHYTYRYQRNGDYCDDHTSSPNIRHWSPDSGSMLCLAPPTTWNT